DIEANNAITLGELKGPWAHAATQEPIDVPAPLTKSAVTDESPVSQYHLKADRAVSPASEHKLPTAEAKPLGPVNAASSLRRSTDAAATPSGVAGFFERFDPRSNEFVKVTGALAVVVG